MKNYWLTFLVALACSLSLQAQVFSDFLEGFETYTPGERIYEEWWLDWNCGGSCGIFCTDQFALSGDQSGYVPGDQITDPVISLGNKIFGTWFFEFHMYIPTGKEGYFNLQGEVPVGAGQWIIGNVYFNQDGLNPGVGLIDDAPGSPINFQFPHEEWFEVTLIVDISAGISAAAFSLYIDEIEVVPAGTPFTNSNGISPTSLGGANFYSVSELTEFWLDNMCLFDIFTPSAGCPSLETEDQTITTLELRTNPVGDLMVLSSDGHINAASIFSVQGQEVFSGPVEDSVFSLDVSNWAEGTYFLKVDIDGQTQTIKFIK